MYLGAATKGATAKKSLQTQYYNAKVRAKRRAFSLKQGYMSSFINDYIIKDAKTYDDIVKEPVSLETFEDIVINKLRLYKGYSEERLRKEFGLADSKSKSIYLQLALKILGVNTETADEFVKSNTQVKTIRIEENGSIKENMSFPTISFREFAEEDWEESYLYDYFNETRFLYVIYQNIEGDYYLEDAMFWHMPLDDLEGPGFKDWSSAQSVVREGVKFRVSGSRIFNTLPNPSETEIFHLRPHTSKAAYKVPSLDIYKGDIDRDGDTLPNGDIMTKQSFWLNKEYVKKQIEKYQKRS